MGVEDNGNGRGLAVALGVCFVIAVAFGVRERRAHRQAKDAARGTAALAVALAQSPPGRVDAVRQDLDAFSAALPDAQMNEAGDAALRVAAKLHPGANMLADFEEREAAERFLRRQPQMRRQLLALVAEGRKAVAQGRDPAPLRAKLNCMLRAAAAKDKLGAEAALAEAEQVAGVLPFTSSFPGGAPSSAGSAAERARAVLLEIEHPSLVAQELMTEGYAPVQKIVLLARARLAAGKAQHAVWLAEVAAHLLGLRAGRGPRGPEATSEPLAAVALPTASESHVKAMLETGRALLQGKQAAGEPVFPAGDMLAEAERLLALQQSDEANLLASSALNVLGMTDDAIARLKRET